MRLLERQRQAEMRSSGAVIRPAKTSVIVQAMVEGGGRWKTPDVMSAIDDHETGEFSRSGSLAQHMERDDRISACTRTRCNALTGKNGLKFTLEPAEGEGRELADRVMPWWFRALPDATMRQLHADAIMMGFAVARIHWAFTDAEWIPARIERWHPMHARVDSETGRYAVRTYDDEILIDPDDPEWIVLKPGGQDRSWMAAGVRSLGLAYVMRQFTWRDWARYNEKHGLPLIQIEEPGSADDKTRRAFFGSVAKMGSTGIVRVPVNNLGQGFKLSYVEAKDRAYGSFAEFRRDLDVAIAVNLLGQNLTTEVQGGSFAATTAHERIRQDYLAADSEILATGLRDQLIVRWGRFNVRGWTDDRAPWPTWDCSVPVDRKAEADTVDKAAGAISKLQLTGMPIDYTELLARVGLPVQQGADANKVEPPAPPAPAVPPGGEAQQRGTRLAQLASGGPAPRGFLNGQMYADDLVDLSQKRAGKSVSTFLAELLDVIEAGTDYESLRRQVLAFYDQADPPDEVRDVLEKALTLAELAGRHAVDLDAPEDDDEAIT